MAAPLLESLRPKPFRGDVIAAGVVVLATLVWALHARFAGDWTTGVHLAYTAGAWAFVTTLAVLAPMERETPRAYQSVLYVASFAIAVAGLADLAHVLGGDLRASATKAWYFAALAALMLFFATARKSAAGTLLGALSAGVALLALADWALHPSAAGLRRMLLGLVVVYALTAVGQRDRRFRHGVALVEAAGVAALALGLSFSARAWSGYALPALPSRAEHVGWGWQLLLLAVGCALIAYSSVDREPGPAYLGVLNLLLFVAVAGGGFLGWPALLLAIAVVLLAIGLRPTTPAPPPPDADAPPAPPLPLR